MTSAQPNNAKAAKKILIVDDDVDVLEVLQRTLEKAGYVIAVCENGKDAKNYVEENPIDLILCDIIMPEADGLEVLLDIRKRFPSVPFIAMSGGGNYSKNTDFLEIARILGAAESIRKPFESGELLKLIGRNL